MSLNQRSSLGSVQELNSIPRSIPQVSSRVNINIEGEENKDRSISEMGQPTVAGPFALAPDSESLRRRNLTPDLKINNMGENHGSSRNNFRTN